MTSGRVIAYGPEEFTEEGFEITAELRDAQGSGYDIAADGVGELLPGRRPGAAAHDGGRRSSSAPASGRRRERRCPSSPRPPIRYSAVLPEKSAFEVRVADVSRAGSRFWPKRPSAVGDTMRVDAILRGRNVIMDVRVARIDPAAFGRYRMGCEITRIGAADRAFLADLAAAARSGSPEQRRPGDDRRAQPEPRREVTAEGAIRPLTTA